MRANGTSYAQFEKDGFMLAISDVNIRYRQAAHYDQQISRLAYEGIHPEVALALDQCMRDEDHHREDARCRQDKEMGLLGRCWQGVVEWGSATAVVFARIT